ncbi:MAG: hypothetical protein WCO44_12435 [Bacteroidota bacterium]
MSEFEIWVYRGAIVVLLGILWYLAKGVLKELKLIREFLQELKNIQTRQDEIIKGIQEHVGDHKTRLDNHSERIRNVELKQGSCQYCRES